MRALVSCVLSFVLALIVGVFALHGTAPPHKPGPKALKLLAQDAPGLEMLPALPSLRATRPDGPSHQRAIEGPVVARALPTARPKAGASSRPASGASLTHPAVSRRGHTTENRPAAIAQRIPKVTSNEKPPHVPQTEVVATVPASGMSQPPKTSTTLPPVVAPPRDMHTAGASPRRRQDPLPRSRPDIAQTPTPDVAQVTAPSSAAAGPYVLGPGDQLEVNVPHLAVTVTIKPDGLIVLPLIGEVKAAGKTTAQLASDLTTGYSKFLDAPSVTVFVRQYRMTHEGS